MNQPVNPDDPTRPIPDAGTPGPPDATQRMPAAGETPPGPPPPPVAPPPGTVEGDDGGGSSKQRWWWIALAAIVAIGLIILLVVLLGDDDDDDGSAPATTTTTSPATTTTTEPATTTTERATTTTEPPPAAPTIQSFTGPSSVACTEDTTVELSWSTDNATRTTIAIDGAAQPGSFGASASENLPFVCSGSSHTYLLTAFGENNRTVTDDLTITVSQ